jgi:A/G-specific adenine glycosylase
MDSLPSRAADGEPPRVTPRRALLRWYERHGRAGLPWRRRRSAYRTLVSEFMLQQTQVDRVVPAFEAFVNRFPTMRALAAATRADVLRAWRGLGYNARAVRLHETARIVVAAHRGRLPRDTESLRALPGIGAYTAAAIRTFAFDLDELPIDVNIGRVLHRLGKSAPAIGKGGFAVASALMDLGARLCTARNPQCDRCPIERSCEKVPLPSRKPRERVRFEETTRYARGRIVDRLRELPPGERISLLVLHDDLSRIVPERTPSEVRALVADLAREGLVALEGDEASLP